MNSAQIETSKSLLGRPTVDMLLQVHEDALWMLENLGVGCAQPDMLAAFQPYESDGKAIVYQNRVYVTQELVGECLAKVPGIDDFFVPRNSFFVGGTAPYVYDDVAGQGGVMPTAADVARIAAIAEASPVVAGMGRGLKLKDEVEQMETMTAHCSKPMYYAVTTDRALEKARAIHAQRGREMVVFCLTRPCLEINENFSDHFVKVVRAGLPVFISAMPMAGISAPYCYNGVLTMTHADALFGICAAQVLNPGITCIHGGYPAIADSQTDDTPNYGLIGHTLANILMAHLNMMLDLPTCQSACTTNEEHLTERQPVEGIVGCVFGVENVTEAMLIAAGEKSGPSRAAIRVARSPLHEPNPVRRYGVDVGRRNFSRSVEPDIGITEVVRHQYDEVR